MTEFIEKKIWGPDISSLSGVKAFFLKSLRILYAAVRDIYEGQLTLRAMSLVYTTLLSLVPLIAVSFSVLKAFGVHYQMEPFLHRFLAPFGPREAEITNRIIDSVNNINAGVLGSLGIAMLIYTAVSVIQKIEDSFNFIWKVSRPRGFMRRLSNYISITLIGPALIVSALGLTASVLSTNIVRKLLSIEIVGTAVYVASKVIPYTFVCAAFTFAYLFIPNTKVHVRSALAGGIIAGVLWETSGWAFASFTVSSAQYSAIYSGFAVVILFMIWVYLSWLILFIGAVISFYHQYPRMLTSQKVSPLMNSSRFRERLAFSIMFLIGYSHYHNTPPWTLDTLISHLHLPVEPVQDILKTLTGKRLLMETCGDPPALIPARDIGMITQREILESVRSDSDSFPIDEECAPGSPVDRIVGRIDKAIEDALDGSTLKTLVLSCNKDSEP